MFLASQRRDIVTGTVEPTDEECEWHSDRDEEDELAVSSALICLIMHILVFLTKAKEMFIKTRAQCNYMKSMLKCILIEYNVANLF